ncbi:1724_t:CDS:2, partial [Acaulospora morrowiae]
MSEYFSQILKEYSRLFERVYPRTERENARVLLNKYKEASKILGSYLMLKAILADPTLDTGGLLGCDNASACSHPKHSCNNEIRDGAFESISGVLSKKRMSPIMILYLPEQSLKRSGKNLSPLKNKESKEPVKPIKKTISEIRKQVFNHDPLDQDFNILRDWIETGCEILLYSFKISNTDKVFNDIGEVKVV